MTLNLVYRRGITALPERHIDGKALTMLDMSPCWWIRALPGARLVIGVRDGARLAIG